MAIAVLVVVLVVGVVVMGMIWWRWLVRNLKLREGQ